MEYVLKSFQSFFRRFCSKQTSLKKIFFTVSNKNFKNFKKIFSCFIVPFNKFCRSVESSYKMNSFAPLLFFLLAMILIANTAGSVRLKTGDYQTVWKNNYKLKKLRHDLGEYEDYVYNDKGNTAISKSAQNDMNKSQGILKNAIRSVNQANKHQVTQPAATEKESAMIDKTSENIKIMRNKEFSKAAANKVFLFIFGVKHSPIISL